MKIACGFDHAGVPLREEVFKVLREAGQEPIDLGTDDTDPIDYPAKALDVARAVLEGAAERGILVCGSGAGVAVAASKVPGIRATIAHDTYVAHQAVEHDAVNVICLGARVVGPELAGEIIRTFVRATFDGAERHERRLEQIEAIERDGLDAPLAGPGTRK